MSAFLKKERKLSRAKKISFQISPLQKQLVWGFLILLVVVLFFTAIWFLTRIDSLQVKHISVIGGETIPHAQIEEKVETALRGAYFALIPKRFIPLYPRNDVEKSIRTINRVKNVRVESTADQTLTVVFDEHVPYALWCESAEDESCLFMDRSGYAFSPAPALEGSAFVRYISDTGTPEVGISGFESIFVKDTEEFSLLLQEQLSLYVTHIKKVGTFDVDYTISGGGVIKVSQSIPMRESFENLQTILLSEEFKHIEPGTFQYIDLRFGDKVFVNEEAAAPEMDAATSSASEQAI